jgi:hypothetical protein
LILNVVLIEIETGNPADGEGMVVFGFQTVRVRNPRVEVSQLNPANATGSEQIYCWCCSQTDTTFRRRQSGKTNYPTGVEQALTNGSPLTFRADFVILTSGYR